MTLAKFCILLKRKDPYYAVMMPKEQAYHVKFIKFKKFAPGLYYKVDSHKEYMNLSYKVI